MMRTETATISVRRSLVLERLAETVVMVKKTKFEIGRVEVWESNAGTSFSEAMIEKLCSRYTKEFAFQHQGPCDHTLTMSR